MLTALNIGFIILIVLVNGFFVAARWIQGKTGVYEFSETFDEILKSRES